MKDRGSRNEGICPGSTPEFLERLKGAGLVVYSLSCCSPLSSRRWIRVEFVASSTWSFERGPGFNGHLMFCDLTVLGSTSRNGVRPSRTTLCPACIAGSVPTRSGPSRRVPSCHLSALHTPYHIIGRITALLLCTLPLSASSSSSHSLHIMFSFAPSHLSSSQDRSDSRLARTLFYLFRTPPPA
jgi:hypothetical protein